MPILSIFLQHAAPTCEHRDGDASLTFAPMIGPRTVEDLQFGTSAAGKRVEDKLVFLLCCSNRIAVLCDSRRHFDDIATFHGQEDGMAKKATTTKAKAKTKPAAKKTAKKTTTAAKRKPAAKKK
jgi:hypothetical protein